MKNTILTPTEASYRRIINRIGIALLIFVGALNVLVVIWTVFDELLASMLSPVMATVVSQSIYAVVYLSGFMIPALLLKPLLGKEYRPPMFDKKPSRDSALFVVGGIALVLVFAYINSILIGFITPSGAEEEYAYGTGELSGVDIMLSVITIAITPALCEEFLFRGVILSALKPFGKAPAIVISAVLFGFMHQNPAQFLYTTVAGLVMAWVVYETGSVWCSVILHFFNNLISVIQSVMLDRLSESTATLAIWLLEFVIFAAGAVCLVFIIIRHCRREAERLKPTEGIFGKPLSLYIDREAPTRKLRPGRIPKLFFSPAMIAFIVIAGVSMCLALVMI